MRPFPFRRRAAPEVTEESGDADLVAAVAARSTLALRLLHQRHAPWLRARLARRCADPDAVDDALQETFLAVWRSAGGFRGEDPAAWLWTIAIRRLISVLRGSGSRWIGSGVEPRDDSPVTSAEDTVLLNVEHGDLGTALTRLSPELRAVIEATVLDGLTTKEAAGLLGIPEGTPMTWGHPDQRRMLAEDVAFRATGLDDSARRHAAAHGRELCDVRGQARTVVALWLVGQVAVPEARRALHVDAFLERVTNLDWGPAEIGYAKLLLASPAARERIAANWDTLVKPATSIDQALPLLGLERGFDPPMGATPCM